MTDMLEFKISKHYKDLRPSEKKVADYILRCDEEIGQMTLTEFADKVQVSQPTIMRFVKCLGFEGFKEFKYEVMQDNLRKEITKITSNSLYGFAVEKEDVLTDVPAKVVSTITKIMQDTLKSISLKEYVRAIDAITGAENIVVYGVENSACTVSDLVTKLLYLGLECRSYQDYYLQSVSAGNLGENDLAIGISYSGCSRNTVEVLRAAKKAGAKTIAITNFENALISKYADIVICGSTKQFLYGNAIFSRTSQIAIVDMIYTGVLLSDYEKFTKRIDRSSKAICSKVYEIKETQQKGNK